MTSDAVTGITGGTTVEAARADLAGPGGYDMTDVLGMDLSIMQTLGHSDYGLWKLARSATPANKIAIDADGKVAVNNASDIAAAVWAYGTRTLTAITGLLSSIWEYATRTLTGGVNVTAVGGTEVTGPDDLKGGGANVTLGAVVAVRSPGNRNADPVPLEMHQTEAKTFVLAIQDADGDPVDLSGVTPAVRGARQQQSRERDVQGRR